MSIHVDDCPGGYLVTLGDSYLRLTESQAAELTAILGSRLLMPRTTTPSKARLMRYPLKDNT